MARWGRFVAVVGITVSMTAASTPTVLAASPMRAAAPAVAPALSRGSDGLDDRRVPSYTPSQCQGITINGSGAPAMHKCPSKILFGVTAPPSPQDIAYGLTGAGTNALVDIASQTGHPVAIAADYQGWAYEPGFNLAQAQAAANAGAVEEINWEPWDYAQGVNQPTYSDRAIANGAYDGFLARWAAGAKAYGEPLFVRFAAEMNGNWDSWAVGVNGNTAADYVAMWRHVYSYVRAQGALNVSWVWSPNVSFPGSAPLSEVFPGNDYVDVVALDGYNRGTALSGTQWQSFTQIFGADLSTLSTLAPTKPIWLAEVGSAEQGGNKAAWVTNLVTQVLSQPQVVGFAWFNFDQPPIDWSMSSSAPSLSAFQAALSGH